MKWNRIKCMLAVMACGGLAMLPLGCLVAATPTGGRLLVDGLLDVVLGWTR